MRFVSGFDDEILEALGSDDAEVHYHAVCAAGNWEGNAAWSHIADLVTSDDTDKSLRLAAIEAVAGIRPQQAVELLVDLTDVADDDIVEAAYEALAVARALSKEDFDESML
jgi:HEAT repeat protein